MRKRDANASRFLLGVVVTIALVWLASSIRESANFVTYLRTGCDKVTTTVTTKVRLIESTEVNEPSPETNDAARSFAAFVPRNVLSCKHVPEVNLSLLNRRSVVERAFEMRAGIAGFHNKSGMLAPRQWRPEYKAKRNELMSVWFSYSHKHRAGCGNTQPPLQYPGCVVNINHHYKFIWIKGKRVGSTAIREPLGWICNDDWLVPKDADRTHCSEQLQHNKETSMEEARRYWDEYFVFSFVRNPYTRFASGYQFVSTLMGSCPKLVNFGKLCESPFLFAKICSALSCCWSGAVTHHLHHAMEQSSCLFTDDGLPAVDFIGEMESLKEDLQIVLDEINRRKPAELPDLRIKDNIVEQINSQGEDYIRQLYLRNTTCLERVERNYWADFERLGYGRVTATV